jgi:hypothetical protein
MRQTAGAAIQQLLAAPCVGRCCPELPRFSDSTKGTTRPWHELIDLARKLAREGFDEHVDALVEEAGNDETVLALAAAQVSTEPPMQSGSVDQIAYSLLVEAFQKASASDEGSPSLVRMWL